MLYGKLDTRKRITLISKGLLSKKNAYIGPEIVEFDLTDKCDNSCLACWVHSPLLKEFPQKIDSLKTKVVKRTLKELAKLKTRLVVFSGGGEPFLHPDIFDILNYSKKLGLECKIVTSFTNVNKEKIEKLVKLEVDNVTVSIWAGTSQTYIKLHPTKNERTFSVLRDNLKYLTYVKQKFGSKNPKFKIYNVISSYNLFELEEMLDFALDVGAENLEFQTVDIIPGVTEFLSINKNHKKELQKQFLKLRKRVDCPHHTGTNPNRYDSEHLKKEFREFGRFLEKIHKKEHRFQEKSENDWGKKSLHKKKFDINDFYFFSWAEFKGGQKHICRTLTCPNGVTTLPTVNNPEILEEDNLLIFKFPLRECQKCQYQKKCDVKFKSKKLKIKYLSLLGFGSFYRRIMLENSGTGEYDKGIIQDVPCYAGWIYSRILCNGDVIPCCKAHLVPLGNIYERKFSKIWSSNKYKDFRIKSRNIKTFPEYFDKIKCDKGCDNLGMNLKVHADLIKIGCHESRSSL